AANTGGTDLYDDTGGEGSGLAPRHGFWGYRQPDRESRFAARKGKRIPTGSRLARFANFKGRRPRVRATRESRSRRHCKVHKITALQVHFDVMPGAAERTGNPLGQR